MLSQNINIQVKGRMKNPGSLLEMSGKFVDNLKIEQTQASWVRYLAGELGIIKRSYARLEVIDRRADIEIRKVPG